VPRWWDFEVAIVSIVAAIRLAVSCGRQNGHSAGLSDEQQFLLVEKDSNSRISTREVLPVRFSVLEQAETG
jgi:hypothetical protein